MLLVKFWFCFSSDVLRLVLERPMDLLFDLWYQCTTLCQTRLLLLDPMVGFRSEKFWFCFSSDVLRLVLERPMDLLFDLWYQCTTLCQTRLLLLDPMVGF